MKKSAIIIILIAITIFGWWNIRPLLVDDVVDEAFPITLEDEAPKPAPRTPDDVDADQFFTNFGIAMDDFEAMNEEDKMEMERNVVEELMEKPDKVMEESMLNEASPTQLKKGIFNGADDFHKGSGDATIYQQADGSHLLRLENFSVTNGPDLRVYLVKDQNPGKAEIPAGIELSKLKGNKGAQNYLLPTGVDPVNFGSVVIYCKPFSVIFATANLN